MFNSGRFLLFTGPLEFCEILEMEHLHIIYWLVNTPCVNMRERQILSVSPVKLERYLCLLDPEYASLFLCVIRRETCVAILYRLHTNSVARILVRLPANIQEKLLNMLDDFSAINIKLQMKMLPRNSY